MSLIFEQLVYKHNQTCTEGVFEISASSWLQKETDLTAKSSSVASVSGIIIIIKIMNTLLLQLMRFQSRGSVLGKPVSQADAQVTVI